LTWSISLRSDFFEGSDGSLEHVICQDILRAFFNRAVKLSAAIVDCFEKKAEGVKSNPRESVCGVAVNTKGLLGDSTGCRDAHR
jgi:hypothetical protein